MLLLSILSVYFDAKQRTYQSQKAKYENIVAVMRSNGVFVEYPTPLPPPAILRYEEDTLMTVACKLLESVLVFQYHLIAIYK